MKNKIKININTVALLLFFLPYSYQCLTMLDAGNKFIFIALAPILIKCFVDRSKLVTDPVALYLASCGIVFLQLNQTYIGILTLVIATIVGFIYYDQIKPLKVRREGNVYIVENPEDVRFAQKPEVLFDAENLQWANLSSDLQRFRFKVKGDKRLFEVPYLNGTERLPQYPKYT